jgi:Toastrack DUF4097
VKARKLGLLLLILGFGAVVETAWGVKTHLSIGPEGCRILTGRFQGPSYSFSAEERRSVPPGLSVEVENAFGDVSVEQGGPGEVQLSLRKVVYLPTEARAHALADTIRPELELSGATLRVRTNRRDLEQHDLDEIGFETHISLKVPTGSSVKVRNEHGLVEVRDAALADVTTSYAGIRVERVSGAATLSDRHGDVSASDVQGALSLESRYGDVTLTGVTGPASLDVEHGDVTVKDVASLKLVQRYGDLSAERIGGSLEVSGEHAGVSADGVSGSVEVETSYRSVQIANVKGDARVKTKHGAIKASDLGGALHAESEYEDVEARRVAGPVAASVSHGGFRGEALRSGATLHTSGDDVVLEDVFGPVDIDAQRGNVRVAPGSLSSGISVTNGSGGIRLEVPAAAGFELEALAPQGEVQIDLRDAALSESSRHRALGRVGSGGPTVRLTARRGDVRVEARGANADAKP